MDKWLGLGEASVLLDYGCKHLLNDLAGGLETILVMHKFFLILLLCDGTPLYTFM
jgi:hypothetical protein